MASIRLDTLALAKRPEAAGLPAEQAEASAEASGEATGIALVTKDYLETEFAAAKDDLIEWIAGLLSALAGLVTAFVKPPGFRYAAASRLHERTGPIARVQR